MVSRFVFGGKWSLSRDKKKHLLSPYVFFFLSRSYFIIFNSPPKILCDKYPPVRATIMGLHGWTACHNVWLGGLIHYMAVSEGKGQVQRAAGGRSRGKSAAAFKAASAKHPCVHEIRVSTSDSCCWVVTVKQIMSAGGSVEIPLSFSRQRKLQRGRGLRVS